MFYANKIFSTLDSYNNQLKNYLEIAHHQKLIVEDTSIKKVGLLRKKWEEIRGAFGFVNRTSKESIEFVVIQFLVYGAEKKWINDNNISDIDNLAQKILFKKPYHKHYTLKSLIETIKNVYKLAEFQNDTLRIYFNEFNEIYFQCHEGSLAKRSIKVLCHSFFRKFFLRIFCCCCAKFCLNVHKRMKNSFSLLAEEMAIKDAMSDIRDTIRLHEEKAENIKENVKQKENIEKRNWKEIVKLNWKKIKNMKSLPSK